MSRCRSVLRVTNPKAKAQRMRGHYEKPNLIVILILILLLLVILILLATYRWEAEAKSKIRIRSRSRSKMRGRISNSGFFCSPCLSGLEGFPALDRFSPSRAQFASVARGGANPC